MALIRTAIEAHSAMTLDPEQYGYWRDFYEQAWAVRAAFVHAMIDAGETNPYRILKRLEAHERKFEVKRTSPEETNYRRLHENHANGPGGLPPFRKTTIRGQVIEVNFHASGNLQNFIIDYIAKAGPYDAIIELGCGYGRNLFEIF
jgi:hypothetical protein